MNARPEIVPYPIAVPDSAIEDLRARLSACRWPERETVDDRSQGVPLHELQTISEYWHDRYDWRRFENWMNRLGSFRTEIEGLPIHFFHVRSSHPDALPMVMTHGWPGSIVEFRDVIEPLVEPTRHGGDARDAFHLVLPSLPGYGFSGKPDRAGWGVSRTAGAWAELMCRLGYRRYVAQGGDWGADVAAEMGRVRAPRCVGIHLNTLFFLPSHAVGSEPTAEETRTLERMAWFDEHESGYFKQQATRPQTVGYGLADSPIGQAAWIYEKIRSWSDQDDPLTFQKDKDRILDNIMLYWLTNSGSSSARMYWENDDDTAFPIDMPVGVTLFRKDINVAPRAWAERFYKRMIHWNELEAGGHFGAWEQPASFVRELRTCFRSLRDG